MNITIENPYVVFALQALAPAFVTAIFLLLEKYTEVKDNLTYEVRQIVYGVVFGIIAIYGTEKGVQIPGAVINTRDAAVVTAGLVFGAPAGIIAGIIGGVERWMAVRWGVGAYTQVACTVSTILAGFYSAILRKKMFEDKRPSIGLAFAVGLVMEVFHMVMVFITNMDDAAHAAEVVKTCAKFMVPANALGVMVSAIADSIIMKKKKTEKKELPSIAQTIQTWLLVTVVIIFGLTTLFMYNLQTSIAERQAQDYLTLAISDVESSVENTSNSALLKKCYSVKELINKEPLEDIAKEQGVVEINVVNKEGIIIDSTEEKYIKFDMASGEQSAEFLCLLDDVTEYVQDYGAISFDEEQSRKYAGIRTANGFLQVAFDAGQIQAQIASEVKDVSIGRHVGNTGYIIIADTNEWVVSQPQTSNINRLAEIQFNKNNINNFFRATLNNEDCYCYCVFAEGYYIISVLPVTEAYSLRDIALYANTFMEILVFALLFGMIYQLIKSVIVNKVDKVNASLSRITDGDLNEIVNVRSNSEFNSLSNDINSTVDTLKKYIAEASARIDAELEYAKNIQNSALPHAFPNSDHFELYALMDAAKEVGGDFYDFIRLDGNTFNFLVADVSGKGIPGALFMMRAKSVLSTFTEMKLPVNDVFTNGNDRLCEGNDAGMFVTAWEASLNLDNGHINYANAGHNPPVIRRVDGTVEFVKGKAGFVLAGMEGIPYKAQELDLKPGDIIFLYTDGVVEATSLDKELYGDDRLLKAMANAKAETMEGLCNEILADVNKFVGEAEQFDDITMLALKYLG